MAVHRTAVGFEKAIERYARQVREGAEEAVRDVVAEGARQCIELTPISTGRAASNWSVGDGERPPYDPRLRASAGDIEDAEDSAVIEAHKTRLGDQKVIGNAVPYGPLLDAREHLLDGAAAATASYARRRLRE